MVRIFWYLKDNDLIEGHGDRFMPISEAEYIVKNMNERWYKIHHYYK